MRMLRVLLTLQWIATAGHILASARSEARAQPPTELITAKAIEVQGLKDKTPIEFRDMAAYSMLLKRARETKPADLAKQARRGVGFRELWDHPEDYRGVLVELRGLCRRIDSSGAKLGARGPLHEVWITLPENHLNVFACVVEDLPEGLAIQAAVSEAVVFHGFFLKVMAYDAGDGRRGAPLLIGRLDRVAGEKPVDALDEDQARRLPLRVGPVLAAAREEERLTFRVDRAGTFVLDGEPIARDDLAGRLARLALQIQLNARAVGMPPDANRELPAIIVIRPDDETPCSTLERLMLDCRRSGFARFILTSPTLDSTMNRVAETRAALPARDKENDLPAALRTIPILLVADDRGRLALAEVGEVQHLGFDALRAELTSILQDPELSFDRARISVDPRLMCLELIRVMEVLTRLNVTRIELSPPERSERSSSP